MLQFSDRVAVFYAGKIAETGPASELRHAPQHPYTQGLIRAFPTVHGDTRDAASIPGAPPSLMNPPAGCRFHPRCPHVMDVCRTVDPKLLQIGPRHAAACHLLDPAVAKAAPTAT
jgi:oligopeptide/dipeptide ABC transporter ATP-binding protein